MALEEVTSYVEQLSERNPLDTVGIFGGESLLKPELVFAMGKMAKDYGVPNVMIAGTNCAWATSDERTRQILTSLMDADIGFGFSMDAFHQEFVPLDRVERACRIARELGMTDGPRPNAVFLESMEANNPYDQRTRELAAQMESMGYQIVPCPPGRIMYSGRATNLSIHDSGSRSVPDETCRDVPWVCGSFERPSGIQIDCDGWVMVEHGISIGNTKKSSLPDILDDYDPEDTPIFS
jgi:hypothetical protein